MISLHNQRILFSDNGALFDYSLELNDYRSGEVPLTMVTGEDYFYIAQPLPFANRYFDIKTATNTLPANAKIEYWSGSQWFDAIDIITDQGTAPFGKSGYVSFKTDRDHDGWGSQTESKDIPELATGPQIYDMYWLRISFDQTLEQVDHNFIGHIFSSDDELFSWYPALNNTQLMDSYEPDQPQGTKTDWQEQSLMAAEYIINRMMGEGITLTGGQLLDYQKFNVASIHKVAHIIFGGMGDGYEKDSGMASARFEKSFNMKHFGIDANKNARLDDKERKTRTGVMGR